MATGRWIAALLVLSGSLWAGETPAEPRGALINAVVALANNEPVTKLEVDAVVSEMLRGVREPSIDQIRAARETARDTLIQQKLLAQEARRLKIQVDPEQVNARVEQLKKIGVDAEARRDLIREQLMIQNMLIRLMSARAVTPEEIEAYYKTHPNDFVLRERRHVHVIAIYGSGAGGKPGAKAKAADIRDRITQKGEDFAALARKHSNGAFADKGGDFGWVEKGALVGPIDEAAAKLKPGDVSPLVETDDGYLIVKVAGVQPASRQSLAEARPEILRRLQDEHRDTRRRTLIGRLTESASILTFNLEPKKP